MIVEELFINELDGKELKRLYSDSGFYLKERATKYKYAEAIIPCSRSKKEFVETSEKIEEQEKGAIIDEN